MKYGLKDNLLVAICQIFSSFTEIEKVILYGSRAKGNYKNGSDIDLTFVGEKLNLTILNKIELSLDELLLPYTFDCSIYHQISNKELTDHINRVGIIVYSKMQ